MSIKSWIKRQITKVIQPAIRNPAERAAVSKHQGIAPHSVSDIVDYYEKYTPAYHEVCGEVFQGGRPTNIEELLDHELHSARIEDGQRLLDAGCGVGGPAIWFAKHKQVTIDAVTVSPTQLSLAQTAVERAGLADRVKIHLGDFHKLDELLPVGSYDRIYFLESICHAENYERVLTGAWKMLKPGGCLYIKDYLERDFSHDLVSRKRADEFLRKLYTEYLFTLLQPHELTSLLEQIGFKIEVMQPIPFTGEKEDQSFQLDFEKKVGFHWREGIDLWVVETFDLLARKPA